MTAAGTSGISGTTNQTKGGPRPRGTCQVCGRDVCLKDDGTTWGHSVPRGGDTSNYYDADGTRRTAHHCPGAYRKAAEHSADTDPQWCAEHRRWDCETSRRRQAEREAVEARKQAERDAAEQERAVIMDLVRGLSSVLAAFPRSVEVGAHTLRLDKFLTSVEAQVAEVRQAAVTLTDGTALAERFPDGKPAGKVLTPAQVRYLADLARRARRVARPPASASTPASARTPAAPASPAAASTSAATGAATGEVFVLYELRPRSGNGNGRGKGKGKPGGRAS